MLLTLTCGTGRGNPGAPRCSHTACAACRKQDSVHMQSGFQLDSVSSAVPPRLLRKWAEWALSRPSVLLGCQARLRRRTSAAVGPTAQHGLPVPRARFTPPPPKKDATTHNNHTHAHASGMEHSICLETEVVQICCLNMPVPRLRLRRSRARVLEATWKRAACSRWHSSACSSSALARAAGLFLWYPSFDTKSPAFGPAL